MTQNNVGIYASQISGHLFTPVGAMDALATVTVPSGGAAIIEFSGIPAGYRHLQIRGITQSTYTGTAGQSVVKFQYNGDTDSNYSWHLLGGNGSSPAASQGFTSQSTMYFESPWKGTGVFGPVIIDILDYASSTKNKTTRILSGANWNSSSTNNQNIRLYSGLWMNKNAINKITFTQQTPYSDGTFEAGSTLALYGIK